jgi:hypothetical protein
VQSTRQRRVPRSNGGRLHDCENVAGAVALTPFGSIARKGIHARLPGRESSPELCHPTEMFLQSDAGSVARQLPAVCGQAHTFQRMLS